MKTNSRKEVVMIALITYVVMIGVLVGLLATGLLFPLYMVFLVLAFIAEVVLSYQKYKYSNKKENDK